MFIFSFDEKLAKTTEEKQKETVILIHYETRIM